MTKEECFYFGYVARTVGIKGELGIVTDVDNTDKYSKLKNIFLEKNAIFKEYKVTGIRFKNDKATIALEGINTMNDAENHKGSSVYLPLELLEKPKGNNFYFHEVLGFSVIDEKEGNIGNIKEIQEYPGQKIMVIMQEKTEILIPIHPELLVSIDRVRKEIHITAPEGLIALYRETKPKEP